jgi:NAD(P)H-quinone oxidoreductase subunit 4L
MLSKSSLITLLAVGISTLIVCAYALGYMNSIEASTYFPPDIFVTGLVVIIALIAIGLGAQVPVLMIIGSLGVFVALTLQQSEPIRYMTLAAMLFCIGLYGMVVSRNAVRVLMSIELMLNAVNINLVTLSRYVDPANIKGQVFAIFILTVAAAEAAVGLAIVLAIYRNMSTVDMEKFNLLKW